VKNLVPETLWRARYDHINAFERLLVDEGTRVIKLYLWISPQEQLRRFARRLEDPARQWKIDKSDYSDRARWDAYVEAVEDVLRQCSPERAPWFVIPADKKWYRNFVVARIVRETLEAMDIRLPSPHVDLDEIRRLYQKS
jgi:polyphosphate kinase 2 (PPK2 family)